MDQIKNALRWSPFIFVMIALIGCATSGSNRQPDIYRPKLPDGITTYEAAIKDLAGLLENRAEYTIEFLPPYFASKKMAYHALPDLPPENELLDGRTSQIVLHYIPSRLQCWTTTIGVRDDMLELSFRRFVMYADLQNLPMHVKLQAFKYNR